MAEKSKELRDLITVTTETIEEGNSTLFCGASYENMAQLPVNMGSIHGFPVVNMTRLVNLYRGQELDGVIQGYLGAFQEGLIVKLAYHSRLVPDNHTSKETEAVFKALKEAYLDQDKQLYIFDNPQYTGLHIAVRNAKHPLHGQVNVVNYDISAILCATGGCCQTKR